jgi:hypothetical protein
MPKAVGGSFDNEQPKSKADRTRRVEPEERLKNCLDLIRRDALAGIVNLDVNRRSAASAADKNAPSRRCVIERVAREIAQDPVEQQRLAHDHRTRRQRAEIDPFAPRWSIELLRKALNNSLDPNRLRHNLAEVPADM